MRSNIYLIRHGITEGNINRWFYGSTDLSLTEEGVKTLEAMRDSGYYPDLKQGARLFTTGLKRTEETLRIIYGDIFNEGAGNCTIEAMEELQEMKFGDYECHSFDEIESDPFFSEWMYDDVGDLELPGGESRNQFSERVNRGKEKLLYLAKEKGDIIVVCHGGVIAEMLERLFPGEKENMWQWMPEPGYGLVLTIEDGIPVKAVALAEIKD